jgi:hypothetical protein
MIESNNERDEIFEFLGRYESLILQKEQYYIGKQAARNKEIEEEGRKARQAEILPWIFGRVNPKICPSLKMFLFTAILKFNQGSPMFMCFHYLEDENPNRIWLLQGMDHGKNYNIFKIHFTEHYLERFEKRGKGYRGYTGNLKEAVVLDLLGGASLVSSGFSSELLGQFIYPEEIMKLKIQDRMKLWEGLKELAGIGDSELSHYLNLNSLTAITKTLDGYGVYSMEGDQIIMITWLSHDMITGKQELLFNTITQKILVAGKL